VRTHPKIAPGQARLTPEFFAAELPEKKVYLGGMSILSILLSLELGCHRCITQNRAAREYGREWDDLHNVIEDRRHLRLRTPSPPRRSLVEDIRYAHDL
jgi:hypothetical protein